MMRKLALVFASLALAAAEEASVAAPKAHKKPHHQAAPAAVKPEGAEEHHMPRPMLKVAKPCRVD